MPVMQKERPAHSVGVDTSPDEDARLLCRVAHGEHAALAALYERWQRPLFAFLLTRTPDPQMAEEVLQDTLVAIWRGAATFQGRSSASTWIFSIAGRQAWNRTRDRSRQSPVDADLTAIPDSQAGPEDIVLARDRVAAVAHAMNQLSPLHREVLILAFEGRLSHAEIAEVLQTPVGTVKSRLSNARRQLWSLTHLSERESADE